MADLRTAPAEIVSSLAQAISFAIDEYQEMIEPLWLEDSRGERIDVRVTEVGTQLRTSSNFLTADFDITTSDGQEFTVRVTPAVS